ncbi:winged helix-turn-helix domain-containing protein [Kitasatospora sp. NPDC004669]|uniref:AfsR/SARP family transcriptional regulator n=1 Tax=Kitasatospora sp. NPDC004669 TaxID=3154555 RepID=UPI0033A9496F
MGWLRFAVLGPVRGWRDGGELALGSPKQRTMLLALLLRPKHAVSTGQLIEDLWGEEPPTKPPAVIRTYVHRPAAQPLLQPVAVGEHGAMHGSP